MSISIRQSVFIIVSVFLLLSNVTFAAETLKNSGLITKNIWYSKDPFFVGDKVRIYSVIFNGSILDLRGRVNFYDKGYLLCTSEFAVLSGRINDVWCDFVVKAGKHSISIKITNPRGSMPGGDEVAVILSNDELRTDEVDVGYEPIALPNNQNVPGKESLGLTFQKGSVENISQTAGQIPKVGSVFLDKAVTLFGSVLRSGKNASVNSYQKTGATESVKPESVGIVPKSNSRPIILSQTSYTNIASIWDTYKQFVARVPYLGAVRDWILSTLKSFANAGNKPMAYVALFAYYLAQFILESPLILTLIFLYIVWRIIKRIYRRNDFED